LIEVNREVTSAVIGAMQGKTTRIDQSCYSAEKGLAVARKVVVTAWQCGSDTAAGADDGRRGATALRDTRGCRPTRNLLEMLESAHA
jgi:hypothetical protein